MYIAILTTFHNYLFICSPWLILKLLNVWITFYLCIFIYLSPYHLSLLPIYLQSQYLVQFLVSGKHPRNTLWINDLIHLLLDKVNIISLALYTLIFPSNSWFCWPFFYPQYSPYCTLYIFVSQSIYQRVKTGCDNGIKESKEFPLILWGASLRLHVHINHCSIKQRYYCEMGTTCMKDLSPPCCWLDSHDSLSDDSIWDEN